MFTDPVYEHDDGSYTYIVGEDEYICREEMNDDDWEEWLAND